MPPRWQQLVQQLAQQERENARNEQRDRTRNQNRGTRLSDQTRRDLTKLLLTLDDYSQWRERAKEHGIHSVSKIQNLTANDLHSEVIIHEFLKGVPNEGEAGFTAWKANRGRSLDDMAITVERVASMHPQTAHLVKTPSPDIRHVPFDVEDGMRVKLLGYSHDYWQTPFRRAWDRHTRGLTRTESLVWDFLSDNIASLLAEWPELMAQRYGAQTAVEQEHTGDTTSEEDWTAVNVAPIDQKHTGDTTSEEDWTAVPAGTNTSHDEDIAKATEAALAAALAVMKNQTEEALQEDVAEASAPANMDHGEGQPTEAPEEQKAEEGIKHSLTDEVHDVVPQGMLADEQSKKAAPGAPLAFECSLWEDLAKAMASMLATPGNEPRRQPNDPGRSKPSGSKRQSRNRGALNPGFRFPRGEPYRSTPTLLSRNQNEKVFKNRSLSDEGARDKSRMAAKVDRDLTVWHALQTQIVALLAEPASPPRTEEPISHGGVAIDVSIWRGFSRTCAALLAELAEEKPKPVRPLSPIPEHPDELEEEATLWHMLCLFLSGLLAVPKTQGDDPRENTEVLDQTSASSRPVSAAATTPKWSVVDYDPHSDPLFFREGAALSGDVCQNIPHPRDYFATTLHFRLTDMQLSPNYVNKKLEYGKGIDYSKFPPQVSEDALMHEIIAQMVLLLTEPPDYEENSIRNREFNVMAWMGNLCLGLLADSGSDEPSIKTVEDRLWHNLLATMTELLAEPYGPTTPACPDKDTWIWIQTILYRKWRAMRRHVGTSLGPTLFEVLDPGLVTRCYTGSGVIRPTKDFVKKACESMQKMMDAVGTAFPGLGPNAGFWLLEIKEETENIDPSYRELDDGNSL